MPKKEAPPRISRILVATDLSARSDRAVERAFLLAGQAGASLTILHVVDADLPSRIADRQADDARALITDHLASLPDAKAIGCDIRIVFGKDHCDILDAADSLPADLIGLGLHHNETRELFRGTTAERVIRGSAAPVPLGKSRPRAPCRRAIVAVDLSECSRPTVEFAARLIPDGELHLLHAFDTPYRAFLTGDEIRREVSQTHAEQMERFVSRECAALQSALAPPAGLFQVVRQGEVRQVLVEQVERLRPDLLVVGTHGRSGIARAMLGSVAEDLLSHPPRDVLAVRP